ncbi:MAG: hypothetical protein A2908_01045 [Candidatus Staskawiczbacteria bacterium RIFCSPLOWO2_01_FULL_38_12b]|uniref:Uncharacterized protein n=1 Tax=Candidatus Staskawiczbacteria bacterium RIFCSPLOWO2_01_FULL_38_12b TaxID=1802214 RepID=A0A1G2IEF9_9BACT|nr:MAG: hypothetical protein A2908_01045 [Candidatus Staskawiczbacteria bacterium RIFCSPLOWO2_01_FULL_38_12b]
MTFTLCKSSSSTKQGRKSQTGTKGFVPSVGKGWLRIEALPKRTNIAHHSDGFFILRSLQKPQNRVKVKPI